MTETLRKGVSEQMRKTVADVMSRDPIVVKPETPLKEAIQILAERRSLRATCYR